MRKVIHISQNAVLRAPAPPLIYRKQKNYMRVTFRLQVLMRRTSRIRKVNVNFAVYIYRTRAQIQRGAHDCSNFLIPHGLADLIIAPLR